MTKVRAFISFDYDNDKDLKTLLEGQAKNSDSPFEIFNMTIQEAIDQRWKESARRRIKSCDVVIVICGEKTHLAKGVAEEVKIAQEEKVRYFLLKGRKDKLCTRPTTAKSTDVIND
ncbi:MAG: TIR domain-containing protein, partial [Thermoguttaceae bacterium]